MIRLHTQISKLVFLAVAALTVPLSAIAQDSEWVSVAGADALQEFISGRTIVQDVVGGGVSKAEYHADGTGVLRLGGASFTRKWEIKGESQICIANEDEAACFELERNTGDASLYRARNVESNKLTEYEVTGDTIVVKTSPKDVDSKGGAATPSAQEIAAELANPNTALGTLNTNFDFTTYDGDLPGANDQTAVKISLQPSLPYPLGGGINLLVRPSIPIILDQPVIAQNGSFDSLGVELGDISFEASLGFNLKHKTGSSIILAGMAGTLPTATDDALGLDQWLVGPQVGYFMVRKWGVIGFVASHQWDVAGEDSFDTSITSGQYSYNFKLKKGWWVFSGPIWSYNHKADSGDKWTLPLGVGLSKAVVFNGRAWKLSVQYWNYIESSDAFGPEHLLRFTIGPVVKLPWKGRQ